MLEKKCPLVLTYTVTIDNNLQQAQSVHQSIYSRKASAAILPRSYRSDAEMDQCAIHAINPSVIDWLVRCEGFIRATEDLWCQTELIGWMGVHA